MDWNPANNGGALTGDGPGKKRVAVTGSTGMVGSHLVAALLAAGYRDIVLPVRNEANIRKLYDTLRREGVTAPEGSLSPVVTGLNDPHGLRDAMRGVHTVFHCAAQVSLARGEEESIVINNVEIAQHVVDSALECGVEKLVHVSSIAALGGPAEGKRAVDETRIPGSLAGASPYAKSKFMSEAEAIRGRELGLKTVIVSPAVLFY